MALLEYLLRTELARPVEAVLRAEAEVHVPSLCDVEVVAGLRRAVIRGALSVRRARSALDDYGDLPIIRHGHVAVLPRILELRDNLSAYDATHVALAEHLGAGLVTADERLRRAVRVHRRVVVLP